MHPKVFSLFIFMIAGFRVSAQHHVKDSIEIWRTELRSGSRFVDSIRIIAMSLDEDHVLLEQRIRKVGDSLNRLAGSDIKMNIHIDPRIDSLNQNLACLNQISLFLTERFDFRLVQLDSCLGVLHEYERKIQKANRKK